MAALKTRFAYKERNKRRNGKARGGWMKAGEEKKCLHRGKTINVDGPTGERRG